MKNQKIILGIGIAVLLFGLSTKSLSQNQSRENILKIGLIEPFLFSFNLAYERLIPNSNLSIQLGGSITQRKIILWDELTPKIIGFSSELQVRYYYPVKQQIAPMGIYVGVFGSYSQQKISLSIPDGKANFLDGNSKLFGFLIGYQWAYRSRLFLDGSIGGGYHFADYSGKFSERGRVIPSIISNGFLPKIDLKVGFGF